MTFIDTTAVDAFQYTLGTVYEQVDTRTPEPYTEEEIREMSGKKGNP